MTRALPKKRKRKTETMIIRMSPGLKAEVIAVASRDGLTLSDLVRWGLDEYIEMRRQDKLLGR